MYSFFDRQKNNNNFQKNKWREGANLEHFVDITELGDETLREGENKNLRTT